VAVPPAARSPDPGPAAVALFNDGVTDDRSSEWARAGVRFARTDAVATVRLARPEQRNAQTPATWRALREIGERVLADAAVRVVVLRAEGRSFSAGLDRAMLGAGTDAEPGLAELAGLPQDALDRTIDGFQQAFTWWRDPQVISIAAVQGHAVGAGFQLALACDLRVLPDLGGTRPLVDAVGYSRALEICCTGRWVGAEEAVSLGLATAVVPRAELDAATDDLVAALLVAPADAVRATKGLLRGATSRTYEEQRAAERAAQAVRLGQLTGGR
jgi:enoyl-CoA hydratase/carnithine racemase